MYVLCIFMRLCMCWRNFWFGYRCLSVSTLKFIFSKLSRACPLASCAYSSLFTHFIVLFLSAYCTCEIKKEFLYLIYAALSKLIPLKIISYICVSNVPWQSVSVTTDCGNIINKKGKV